MTQQRKDHTSADHYTMILWGSWQKSVVLNGIHRWCNLGMRDKGLWSRGRSNFTQGHGWLQHLTQSPKKWLAGFISDADTPFLPAQSPPTAQAAARQAAWLQRCSPRQMWQTEVLTQTDVLQAKGPACHSPLPAPCPAHSLPLAAAHTSVGGYRWGVCITIYTHTTGWWERDWEALCAELLNTALHKVRTSSSQTHRACYKTHPSFAATGSPGEEPHYSGDTKLCQPPKKA